MRAINNYISEHISSQDMPSAVLIFSEAHCSVINFVDSSYFYGKISWIFVIHKNHEIKSITTFSCIQYRSLVLKFNLLIFYALLMLPLAANVP